MKFLPTFPELSVTMGDRHIRHNLIDHSVTLYIKDWTQWNESTQQVRISSTLWHFVQPDGEIVGLKVHRESA